MVAGPLFLCPSFSALPGPPSASAWPWSVSCRFSTCVKWTSQLCHPPRSGLLYPLCRCEGSCSWSICWKCHRQSCKSSCGSNCCDHVGECYYALRKGNWATSECYSDFGHGFGYDYGYGYHYLCVHHLMYCDCVITCCCDRRLEAALPGFWSYCPSSWRISASPSCLSRPVRRD